MGYGCMDPGTQAYCLLRTLPAAFPEDVRPLTSVKRNGRTAALSEAGSPEHCWVCPLFPYRSHRYWLEQASTQSSILSRAQKGASHRMVCRDDEATLDSDWHVYLPWQSDKEQKTIKITNTPVLEIQASGHMQLSQFKLTIGEHQRHWKEK